MSSEQNEQLHQTMIAQVNSKKKLRLCDLESETPFSYAPVSEFPSVSPSFSLSCSSASSTQSIKLEETEETSLIQKDVPDFVIRYIHLRDDIGSLRKEMSDLQPSVFTWLQDQKDAKFTFCKDSAEEPNQLCIRSGTKSNNLTLTSLEESLANFVNTDVAFQKVDSGEKYRLIKNMSQFIWNSRRKRQFQELRFDTATKGAKRVRDETEEIQEDAF